MDNLLLNDFFEKNAVDVKGVPSAQALVHFNLLMQREPEANKGFHSVVDRMLAKNQPKRVEDALIEKEKIESLTDYNQVIKMMRQKIDNINSETLTKKAMEFENEIVPELIKKLMTSQNDVFIESAAKAMLESKLDFNKELMELFDDIRNPYAQSVVLVLLGFKAGESDIPWFIKKYEKLKLLYPDESYCEGAYYGLYEIERRNYMIKNKPFPRLKKPGT